MGMQAMSYTVPEDAGSVFVCAILSGHIERNVLVSISTVTGTAQCKYVSINTTRST